MGKAWKVRLTMEDRVALRTLLLQCKGSFAEQMLADKVSEDVLSKADIANFGVHAEGGQIIWNLAGRDGRLLPDEYEFQVGPEARSFVCRNLLILDEAKALERMFVPLYKRFVLTPWPDPE